MNSKILSKPNHPYIWKHLFDFYRKAQQGITCGIKQCKSQLTINPVTKLELQQT